MSRNEKDAEADPALDDGESADWSSEGGATPEGPATDTDADVTNPEEDQDRRAP
ncbi:MAG: hypothetical protein ACJ72D_14345 [Marmoricola sp.]